MLDDEHPEISTYLRSLTGAPPPAPPTQPLENNPNANDVSALAVDNYTSQQTTDLMEETRRIMEAAERDGTDPDERLREVVERAVRQGFSFGGQLGDAAGTGQVPPAGEEEDRKRTRE